MRRGSIRVGVDDSALALRALVRGRRELALGQAVDAVIRDDIDMLDAAPHRVGELGEAIEALSPSPETPR